MPANRVTSLRRTLKTQMLVLLKHPGSARFHEVMIPALEDLDADPEEISVYDRRAEMRSRQQRAGSGSGGGSDAAAVAGVKREHATDAVAEQPPASKKPREEAQLPSFLAFEVLSKLPLAAVVELVMRSLAGLPDVMPASLAHTAAGGPASAIAVRASKAVRDPRKAAAAAAADLDGGEGGEEGAPLDERVVPALPTPAAAGVPARRQPALLRAVRKAQPFQLKSAPLDADTRNLLLLGAFQRMLDNSARLTEAGAGRARVSLVCRMASMQQLFHLDAEQVATAQDPMSEALLEHLVADVSAHTHTLTHTHAHTHACFVSRRVGPSIFLFAQADSTCCNPALTRKST